MTVRDTPKKEETIGHSSTSLRSQPSIWPTCQHICLIVLFSYKKSILSILLMLSFVAVVIHVCCLRAAVGAYRCQNQLSWVLKYFLFRTLNCVGNNSLSWKCHAWDNPVQLSTKLSPEQPGPLRFHLLFAFISQSQLISCV